jgi:hypothetical protein
MWLILQQVVSNLDQPGEAVPVTYPQTSVRGSRFQVRLALDEPSSESETVTYARKCGSDGAALESETLHLARAVLLDHTTLANAEQASDPGLTQPAIEILFDHAGARQLARVTRQHVGHRLVMVVDGEVRAVARVRAEISSGRMVFTGLFTNQDAKELVNSLRAAAASNSELHEAGRTTGAVVDPSGQPAGQSAAKRQRFEPRPGIENQTSWAVLDKPSFLNPHGWAVKAQMTLGGVARIELPGETGRRCEITLVEGNDDSITVRIVDSARKTSMMLSLLRDRFGQVTVDGAGYRVVYLGVHVAPEASDTSPFAHIVLTPAEEANRDTK